MTTDATPGALGSNDQLGPTLDAWAETAGVQFVSRSYGQYTTGTVSRDALETLLANALHAGIEHGRTQAAQVAAAVAAERERAAPSTEQIDAAIYAQCPDFDQWHEGPSIDDVRSIVRRVLGPNTESSGAHASASTQS
jgi:hypothetical protein